MTGVSKRDVGLRQCLWCGAFILLTTRNYDRVKYCSRPATCREHAWEHRRQLRLRQRQRAMQALEEQ